MKIPTLCPSCDTLLIVNKLKCPQCTTEVMGQFDLPLYMKLPREDQEFILNFFLSSGSIKEMAKQAELSYPTMRNKMDDLIEKIHLMQKNTNTNPQN